MALDVSFEAIAVVFLVATMMYSFRLASLAKDAKIVALAKPQAVFRWFILAFVLLLLSQAIPVASAIFLPIPYSDELSKVLIISTALAGVVGMHMALYYYRTGSRKNPFVEAGIPA
jgi:hypothetical protein